jgi:threonine aldolase
VDQRKSFGSDNHAGAHDAVVRALAQANTVDVPGYGADPWTERAASALRAEFGAQGDVYFVFTGTAANVLGLSLLLRPYEGVICAESAHVNVDECGAPERILGSKLLTVPTPDGKLTPELIGTRLGDRGDEHRVQPRVVTISQVTELGTCYSLEELKSLGEYCRAEGLRLYIDGARLANAAAHLGCSLADLAARADVLSFGGTKNGAMGAEALIVMNSSLADAVPFQRKQQMQLASKMRYLAAQFGALLEDELWLRNAQHANAMARRLADGVDGVPGVRLHHPVESNGVFAALGPALVEPLQREWNFYVWDSDGHAAEGSAEPASRASVVRWMTAFDTTEDDVDAFVAAIRATAGALTA